MEVTQRSYAWRHIVHGKHSAEAMAKRWAAFLAAVCAQA